MRIYTWVAILSLAWTQGVPPPSPPKGSSIVEGAVLRSDKQEPIPEVLISMTPTTYQGAQLTPLTGWTDNAGRFTIENVPQGTYRVTAHRDGYFGPVTESSTEIPLEPSLTLTVGAQDRKSGVDFLLTPGGAIAGLIEAPTGRPAFSAVVRAIPIDGPGEAATVNTNDRGEYRFFWLRPGRYLISSVPPWKSIDDQPADNYTLSYYPGTTDASSATAIELTAGGDIRGVNFSYRGTLTVTVKGKVTSTVPLMQNSFDLYLFPHESSISESQVRSPTSARVPNAATFSDQGQFEIRSVRPGTYDVGVETTGADYRRYVALTPIVVGSANLDDVTVNIQQPGAITGTVIAADASVQGELATVRIQVQRSSTRSAEMTNLLRLPGVSPDAAGRFTISAVTAGGYRLTIQPPSLSIVDVRQNGKSILNDGLTINDGPQPPLEVVVGRAQ